MFHVKHGDVLMDGHLEPLGRRGVKQGFELGEVEIVRGGNAFEAEPVFEIIRRDTVGNVEGIIANPPSPAKKRK